MSRYYGSEPVPNNAVSAQNRYDPNYYHGQSSPSDNRAYSPPPSTSYARGYDNSSRRSRSDYYNPRSTRSSNTRSKYTASTSTPQNQREKPSWVVTGLLTGLVVLAVTGIQVWAHRVSEGGSSNFNQNRERRYRRERERAFDEAKRSRRRDEERREQEEEEESLDGGPIRMEDRPRIEYFAARRQRTRSRSNAPRRLEAPQSDEDDEEVEGKGRRARSHDYDYDHDDDRRARSRRDRG